MPRATDLGISIGALPTGPTNSVLDVPGVGVGHATVWRDEPDPPGAAASPGPGSRSSPRRATPSTRCRPAARCSTAPASDRLPHRRGVGHAGDPRLPHLDHAARPGLRRRVPAADRGAAASRPTTSSSRSSPSATTRCLNDARRDAGHRRRRRARPGRGAAPRSARHATGRGRGRRRHRHVAASASRAASAPRRGSAGAATPSACCCMTNFGEPRPAHRRRRAGRPAARPAAGRPTPPHAGRLVHRRRRHRRAGRRRGLRAAGPPDRARAGPHRSIAHHGSGEIFLGLGDRPARWTHDRSTPTTAPLTGRGLDPLFAAVVEATEEAVLNSMFAAPTTVGRDGQHQPTALPRRRVRARCRRLP